MSEELRPGTPRPAGGGSQEEKYFMDEAEEECPPLRPSIKKLITLRTGETEEPEVFYRKISVKLPDYSVLLTAKSTPEFGSACPDINMFMSKHTDAWPLTESGVVAMEVCGRRKDRNKAGKIRTDVVVLSFHSFIHMVDNSTALLHELFEANKDLSKDWNRRFAPKAKNGSRKSTRLLIYSDVSDWSPKDDEKDPVFIGVICSTWKHMDRTQGRNVDAPLKPSDVICQLRYLSERFGDKQIKWGSLYLTWRSLATLLQDDRTVLLANTLRVWLGVDEVEDYANAVHTRMVEVVKETNHSPKLSEPEQGGSDQESGEEDEEEYDEADEDEGAEELGLEARVKASTGLVGHDPGCDEMTDGGDEEMN